MDKFSVLAVNRHRMKNDGRGITSLVALAGCPLACPYCINRELLAANRISHMTGEELFAKLAIDHCYFLYTGGGVTFGGGEPLLQSGQIAAFAQLAPHEWNLTIETSLAVPEDFLAPVLSERFSFIVDIKAMQPEIHQNYTGKENAQAVRNLKRLVGTLSYDRYVVKVPLIPGYAGKSEVAESVEMLKELGVPEKNIVTFSYIK